MNLLRSLGERQRRVLEDIARGRSLFVPANNYRCLCTNPKEPHGPNRHERRAITALEQRGLVAPNDAGILDLAGLAVAEFAHLRPKRPPQKRTFKMSRTRAARTQA